ncbi:DUF6760 family protein [Rivularia sp. UHCC 0363]|uniref:DUF6760 family protein n=1 Tax=Rivularia sp. UHCC 0363 TaxID=3110244 RepID=UPI002B1FAD93|nr:DUF6760 family protein [Rivularia sp. UHCC 0363]MEA5598416.1 DUF6760 family protein [Rivularia sp. UHCC 0363]
MRKGISSPVRVSGGVTSYPSDTLHEEVAFIAYHFHWSPNDILNLDHMTRQRWVTEINKINQKLL